MFNLQGSEIIVILLLALVVLGPEKLPDAIRRFGRTYAELKKMGSGFQSELKSALDEPVRQMRETADLVRDAADPDKIEAQERTTAVQPGDPPLAPAADGPATDHAPGSEPDSGTPVAERPVNRIAAANSSEAVIAAREAAADEPGDEQAGVQLPGDEQPGDRQRDVQQPGDDRPEPSAAPAGPAFHSAAPRRGAPPAHRENGDDDRAPRDAGEIASA